MKYGVERIQWIKIDRESMLTDILKHEFKRLLFLWFFLFYYLRLLLTDCLLWRKLQFLFDQILNIPSRFWCRLFLISRCGEIHFNIKKIRLNNISRFFFKVLRYLLFFSSLPKWNCFLRNNNIPNRCLFLKLFHKSLLLSLYTLGFLSRWFEELGDTVKTRTDVHYVVIDILLTQIIIKSLENMIVLQFVTILYKTCKNKSI